MIVNFNLNTRSSVLLTCTVEHNVLTVIARLVVATPDQHSAALAPTVGQIHVVACTSEIGQQHGALCGNESRRRVLARVEPDR